MRIQPKYIQLVGDAVIPLAGFFFWNWSLYFILLFYFLDVLASEVIQHLKSAKIIDYQGKQKKSVWRFYGILSFFALVLVISMIHFSLLLIQPSIHFLNELVTFWTYEEFGIQQGFLLLPIIAFGAYQQYKMYFLVPARQRTTQLETSWQRHLKTFAFMAGVTGIISLTSLVIVLPEVAYVGLIVAGVAAYRFFFPGY